MKIYIASDHAGYELKTTLIKYYSFLNFYDCGCNSNLSVDYPDIAEKLCNNILNDLENDMNSIGILICGTGIGMNIVANKYNKIRCALVHDEFTTEMAKKHNNANVISIGARIINFELACLILNKFLNTIFEEGRHLDRLNKINNIKYK